MASRLQQLVSATFQIDPAEVTPDAGPHSISQWDSAGHMNLIVALQREFGIEFGDDEVVEFVSIEAIADALKRKGVAA